MHVCIDLLFVIPIGVEVFRGIDAFGNDVFKVILPAMTALVGREAVEDRLIGGLLHVHIE